MITAIRLISTCTTSRNYNFCMCVVRTFWILATCKHIKQYFKLYHYGSLYSLANILHSPPLAPGNHILLSVSMSLTLFFYIPHISDIMWCLSFSVFLTSLSIMSSRCIHVVTNGRIFFLLMAE